MAVTATVTFLFVDLVGSTELLHRIGDDANDVLTRRYQGLMREVVNRHRGEVLRTAGDGLTVVFEHSVADAVSAAVDMQRVIDRMGRADPLLRLQIRVGLSVGEASRLDGDWSGTPIFEAARLESKARPGTILVNDVIRVLLGNRGGFEFTPIGALELKGFPHPLPASEVSWEPDPGRPEVPLASALEAGLDWPLVGRDAELNTLLDTWRQVAGSGQAALATVTGEAGIGKTRLAAALAVAIQQGQGVPAGTVLYGRADDTMDLALGSFAEALRWWVASVPHQVLRDVVGDRGPTLAALVPSLAARLPELMGGSAASAAADLRRAVVDVIGEILEAGPHLLVIDAAHAATDDTLDLAARLSELDGAVLVLVVGRDDDRLDQLPASVRVRLAGLDPSAVGDLLGAAVGRSGVDDLPVDVVSKAVDETQGNPRLVIEAGERLVASGVLGLTAGASRDAAVRKALAGASPYRGLLAYQAEHADDFFGRDDDVAGLLGRLAAGRMLAVVGASGSGKSSLVRAGLVPALERGALAGSRAWPVVLFNAGPHPLLELAAGVARAVERPVGEVAAAFEAGAGGLDEVVRPSGAENAGDQDRLVVIVDQFEELFTLCRDPAERQRFVDVLLHAVAVPGGRVMLVVVMRADFFGHCADVPGLADAIESATVLLGPLDDAALHAVIEGPARRADLDVEPGLAEVMIRDVAGEPGGLPLLSHALYETWVRREHRALTLSGYRGAGGARGAIARTAESVYTERLDESQRAVARSIFLAVTELGEGTEDTRRRAPRAELVDRAGSQAAFDEVIEILVAARLLTVGDDTVEVAHEAVIREWPRLREWLDEDRATLREVRRLAAAAAEWDSGGRHADDLYRGPRLAAAVDASASITLSRLEQEFVDASRALEEARALQQARQHRRLRRLLAGVGALLVLALIAGGIAYQQRATADERARDADFERLVSQSLNAADSDPGLAFLLALEAHRLRDTPASRAALFTTLQRQRGFLGFSPTEGIPTASAYADDATVAYGARDATVGLVDLGSGRPVGEPVRLGDSPGGEDGGEDGSGAEVHVFVADDPTREAGDPLVVGRADTGQVFLVDPDGGGLLGEPIENDQAVFALASSARLDLVAAGREDGTVAVFRLGTGERIAVLPARGGSGSDDQVTATDEGDLVGAGGATIDDGDAVALSFSPTDDLLAVARSDASVEFWDPVEPERRSQSRRDVAYYVPSYGTLAYRPDGAQVFLFSPSTDFNLRAVDVGSASIDWKLRSLSGAVRATYSPDGDTLFTADAGGDVAERSAATGAVRSVVVESGIGAVQSLNLSPDGERVVLSSGAEPVVGEWALHGAGPLVTAFGAPGQYPQQIAPDSRTVLVTGDDGAYSLWNPDGSQLLDDIPILYGGYADPGNIFGFFPRDITAGQYDLAAEERVPPPIEFDNPVPNGAVFNARTGLLVIPYEDGTVHFYDRDGEQPHDPLEVAGSASVDAMSVDGESILVGSSVGSATLFDVASGQQLAAPIEGESAAAFTDDDRLLIVGYSDGTVRELDAATLDPVGEPLPRLPAPADDLTPTRDGDLLSIVSGNRFRLVDLTSRRQVGDSISLGDPSAVVFGTIAPNGDFLVLSSVDGLETWDLRPSHWRDDACRLAGRNLTTTEWDTYLSGLGSYHTTCDQWPGAR